MNKNPLMNIFSGLKTLYYLIKSSFSLDNRELSGVLKDLSHTHPWETTVKTDAEGHLDFFSVVTQFLSQVNSSEDLSKFNQNLRSVLYLVQESSTEMATIIDTVLHSTSGACYSPYPMLQHSTVAKLSDLFSDVNSSFPLRSREILESTIWHYFPGW